MATEPLTICVVCGEPITATDTAVYGGSIQPRHGTCPRYWRQADALAQAQRDRDAARAEVERLAAQVASMQCELLEAEEEVAEADSTAWKAGAKAERIREERDAARAEARNLLAELEQAGVRRNLVELERDTARAKLRRLTDERDAKWDEVERELARLTEENRQLREALPEIQCPQCGTTVRARMSDGPPTSEQWERAAEAAYLARFNGRPVNPWEFLGEARKDVWRAEVRAVARVLGVPGAEQPPDQSGGEPG